MKNLFISIICIFVLQTSVCAQSQTSKTLSTIENNLYGIEYTNQSDNARLNRIEETVYGEKKSGSIKSRLADLDKDIASEQMGKEVTPRKYAFTNGEDDKDNFYSPKTQQNQQLAQQQDYYEPEEKADPNIEYPVINSLEQTAFGKSYKQMEIKTRISNLEKQAFRKTYSDDDLATRVDRLKEKFAYNMPKSSDEAYFSHNDYYQDESYLADNPQTQYPDNYFSPQNVQQESYNNSVNQKDKVWDRQISDRDFRSKLNKLEKNVYKQSFSNDTVDNRLSRLENTVFNANFSKESDTSRLSRLYGAVNAQKVAKKYDSNGFQQKMATALQIGFMVLMVVAMIL